MNDYESSLSPRDQNGLGTKRVEQETRNVYKPEASAKSGPRAAGSDFSNHRFT
jgi:hypothetical protein